MPKATKSASGRWPDNYVLQFGKYRGKPLDTIPLVYLDWLMGQVWFYGEPKKAVAAYLKDPAIARELEEELRDGNRGGE